MGDTAKELIQNAITEAQKGNKPEAKRLLSQAVKLEPKNVRAWYLLSQFVDQPEQAIYCLEQALKLQPENAQIRNQLNQLRKPITPSIAYVDELPDPSPSYAKETQNDDVIEAHGINGQISVLADRVRIKREGAMAFFTQGIKGEKEILISQISSLQFKKVGKVTNGFIQISFLGGQETKGGILNATQDENTIMFTPDQQENFLRVKSEIEKRISALRTPSPAPVSSYADELEKLASLRDRGIITEDEFQAKKRELLQTGHLAGSPPTARNSSAIPNQEISLPENASGKNRPIASKPIESGKKAQPTKAKPSTLAYGLITLLVLTCVCMAIALTGGSNNTSSIAPDGSNRADDNNLVFRQM